MAHTGRRASWVFLALAAGLLQAQTPFHIRYLADVGNLGEKGKTTSVDLGIARVFAEPEGDLRFEGRDEAGHRWRVWIRRTGGVGGTGVWTADFDHNGRQDLLIATYLPGSGRCIDGAAIYTLMFDDLRRPVPWAAHSNSFDGFGHPPLPILDVNRDGRAEMVTVGCEYSQPTTGFGEDRRISGIYEARECALATRFRTARSVPILPLRNVSLGHGPRGWNAGLRPSRPSARFPGRL